MPFSALLDGQPVISLLMSDEQWSQAKAVGKQDEERLLVGYSRLPGFARTSSLGLRHFAHRKGYAPDYEWSESAEHLSLKAELVRAIAEQGWNVDTEVPSGPEREWIADVLAEQDGQRIAFEVQWSKQSAAEYVRRTQRYADAGIECVWFVRHLPNLEGKDLTQAQLDAYSRIPIFELQDTPRLSQLIEAKDESYRTAMIASVSAVSKGVVLGKQTMMVSELAKTVLDGKVRVRNAFFVIVYIANCQRCRKPAIYWQVAAGKKIPFERLEQEDLIQGGAKRAGVILDPMLPLARFDSHSGESRARLDFLCPHCNAPQPIKLANANMVSAARSGRGLRFEVLRGEKWEALIQKWEIRTSTSVKLVT